MIGGTVVKTEHFPHCIVLTVEDGRDEREIVLEPVAAARCVEKGDKIWWRSENAYWTPKFVVDRKREGPRDYMLKRHWFKVGLGKGTNT